ncbi:MAG: tRNA pseudouridine(55) synthase TruB [Rickettsiales bacterium]
MCPSLHGWLNLYKPSGVSSNHYLNRLRRLLGKGVKVGHAGTLDPLAEGVLPVALGEATKCAGYGMGQSKTYWFTVTWGESTDTLDAEGAVIARSDARPSAHGLFSATKKITGRIRQIPPVYSAIKIEGKRACDRARAGEKAEMAPREIDVYGFYVASRRSDSADFVAHCGKGTYVRALARDLCALVGSEGHVSRLVRSRVGNFFLEDAFLVAERAESAYKNTLASRLMPVDTALDDIPAIYATEAEEARLRCGQDMPLLSRHTFCEGGATVLVKNSAGKPVALTVAHNARLRPKRIINPY